MYLIQLFNVLIVKIVKDWVKYWAWNFGYVDRYLPC